MTSYGIKYTVKDKEYDTIVRAKDIKSAKAKLGKKHGYKTGKAIKIIDTSVIGYF